MEKRKHVLKGCRLPAVHTVELALLMLPILSVVFLGIGQCLLFHDKAKLDAAALQGAEEGVRFLLQDQAMGTGATDWKAKEKKGLLWRITGNTADISAVSRYAAELVRGELLIGREVSFSASGSGDALTLSYSASADFPFLPARVNVLNGNVSVQGIEQEEVIRLMYGLKDREE